MDCQLRNTPGALQIKWHLVEKNEVSVGLEKTITNDITDRINRTVISPQFAAGNYALGFYNGIKAFAERIEANKEQIGK